MAGTEVVMSPHIRSGSVESGDGVEDRWVNSKLQRSGAESESDTPPTKILKKGRRWKKFARRKKSFRHKNSGGRLRVKPVAPFNTTQFLMDEHDQLRDTDIVTSRPRRQRDSSISVESEDPDKEYYYCSPEDEDEFLTNEFWMAYQDVHIERLETMSKSQMVQEYLALEERVDFLERQLRLTDEERSRRDSQHSKEDDVDDEGAEDDDEDDMNPGEIRVDPETAEKIAVFQREIKKLENENRRLREETSCLRRPSSSSSTSSSSSSCTSDESDSCSNGSCSNSDSEGVRDTMNHSSISQPLPEIDKGDKLPCDKETLSVGTKVQDSDRPVQCQTDSAIEKAAPESTEKNCLSASHRDSGVGSGCSSSEEVRVGQ